MKFAFKAVLCLALLTPAAMADISRPETDPLAVVAANPKEVKCLARVIYHEARGERTAGKLAVARVAINRAKHSEFPDSVCAVIRQRGAFPWFARFTPTKSPDFERAYELAVQVMTNHVNGVEWAPAISRNALFFNTVPFTYKRLRYSGKIGNHLFYELKG